MEKKQVDAYSYTGSRGRERLVLDDATKQNTPVIN